MCVEADRRGPTGLGFESEFESESESEFESGPESEYEPKSESAFEFSLISIDFIVLIP